MRPGADPQAFAEAEVAYFESVTAGNWKDAALSAQLAIQHSATREGIPAWQERKADAERRSKPLLGQVFSFARRTAR